MKEKTADIDILEELIRDYKDEKEFVGEEIIKAMETLIAENKELKEMLKHRIEYTNILEKDLFQNASNYVIPKSKVEEVIEELEKDENLINAEYFIKRLQSLLGKE